MIVLPLSANLDKIASRRAALLLSNPDVGSSKINKEGSDTISIATHNLFFYPPEIPFIRIPPT